MPIAELRKMAGSATSDGQVSYRLSTLDGEVNMNELIGKAVRLKFTGTIRCISCGKYVTDQQPSSVDTTQPAVKATGGDEFPLGTYIMADCGVLAIGGLIISALTGWFFIGFSLRPRDWPGMLAFILATAIGAGLAGI